MPRPDPSSAPDQGSAAADLFLASRPAVTAALAGMAGAWIAAGSTGLLVTALRHALTWLALGLVVVAAWPRKTQTWPQRLILAAAIGAAVAMTVPAAAVYNVLAVALLVAMFARANEGADRRVLLVTALAVAVLGVYRLACGSIPTVWLAADAVGGMLGRLAEIVSGKPLWIGATFGGLDFLVLMAALWTGWLLRAAPPVRSLIYAAAGILIGHLLYLVVLAYSHDLAAALPTPSPLPPTELYEPPPWQWSDALRSLVPWNLPLVAGAIQLVVAAVLLCSTKWPPVIGQRAQPAGKAAGSRKGRPPTTIGLAVLCGALASAAILPVLTVMSSGASDLKERKIVIYDTGHTDWRLPEHGRYGSESAGLFGLLRVLLASLGGELTHSAELSEADLARAHVLLLIHPEEALPEDRLERLWEFVGRGGSLLVLTGPGLDKDQTPNAVNQVLESTGMQVRFDTVISPAGYWQYASEALAHPATTGLENSRNSFGLAMGSSIRTRWPARPILIGRWGWSDPGSDAVLTNRYRYDPGEQLGDLVLAAEQRVGRGTVLVLADQSSVANEVLPGSYRFAGRLFGYMAQRLESPQQGGRQMLGLLACLALLVLAAWQLEPAHLAAVAGVLAVSLAACRNASDSSWKFVPEAPVGPVDKIAYVDASHAEAYVDDRWGNDGICGLSLTLARNGYLPLLLPQLNPPQLEQAAMLLSIGPARPFSAEERETVRSFVEEGGIFVCMAGADRAEAVNPLLRELGFRVPRSPVPAGDDTPEPVPMGALGPPKVKTCEPKVGVNLYAAWPIECTAKDAEIVARGDGGLPVIAVRRIGRGKVVVIGDTEFAMNKNLESSEGEPASGSYENAHFWRWLITYLTDQPAWVPTEPPSQNNKSSDDEMDPSDHEPDKADSSRKGSREEVAR